MTLPLQSLLRPSPCVYIGSSSLNRSDCQRSSHIAALHVSCTVPRLKMALPQSTSQRKVYCRVRALDKSSTDRSCGTFSHAQRPCSILSLAHHHTGMAAQHRAKSTRGTAYLHQRCLSYLVGGAVFHDGLVICGISAALLSPFS